MKRDRKYFIYILTNKNNGVLYIGVTNNLRRRIQEHKEKYNIDQLVYYEIYGEVGKALYREKQIKKWNRKGKIELVEKENKNWEDLYYKLF